MENNDTVKKIEIELPFSGFYESIHDGYLDDAIESHFSYDYDTGEDKELGDDYDTARWNADINWQEIQENYAKAYTEEFGREFDLDLEFVAMTSPKYYNFSTDRIFANIPIDQIERIRKEAEAHPEYKEFIRERYTSYDGFSSNFEPDADDEEWTKAELEPVQYRSILDFWIEKVSDAHEDWDIYLMDDFRGNGGMDNLVDDAIDLIQKELDKNVSEN